MFIALFVVLIPKNSNNMKENFKYHECEFLPKEGVRIVYSDSYVNRNKHVWCLVIEREATEKDLDENHYLEEVGELLWSTSVEIARCPYCGKKLFDLKENNLNDYGKFVHIDSYGWQSKIQ